MFSVKTRFANVLIGQSLVVSVLADLCYRYPMMFSHASDIYHDAAATITTACDPLMSSTILLLILCIMIHCSVLEPLYSTTMHWCSSHIIAQKLFFSLIEQSLSRLSLCFLVFVFSLCFLLVSQSIATFLYFFDIMTKKNESDFEDLSRA